MDLAPGRPLDDLGGIPVPRIHTGVTADAAVRAAAHADPLAAALATVTIGSWSAQELAPYYADSAARIRRLAV